MPPGIGSPAKDSVSSPCPTASARWSGARVARLGDRAAKILSTAAIIGRDFDIDLLAEVTGSDEDALLDLLDDAEASDLVCELPGTPVAMGFPTR